MIGRTVSHYRILERLGAGGMGVVYKAKDIRLGRLVALKFPLDDASLDEGSRERFKREARAASVLDHPNICTIYEIDEDKGRPFIVMQLLEGQTLRESISNKPMPLDTLLDWALQIIGAIKAAHARGVVHRDIKPGNIFITDNAQAKVLDFGLAKVMASESSGPNDKTLSVAGPITHLGNPIGTYAYMSPEQVRCESLDERSDLFSFGVLLYEMATGQQAFSGPTWAVTHAILGQAPMPLNERVPGLPRRLRDVIDKALIKDRNLRYQTAAEIHRDLAQVKWDYESGKKQNSKKRTPTWFAQKKWHFSAVALVIVFLVVLRALAGGNAPVGDRGRGCVVTVGICSKRWFDSASATNGSWVPAIRSARQNSSRDVSRETTYRCLYPSFT